MSARSQAMVSGGELAVNCFVEPGYATDVDVVVVETNLEQIECELKAVGLEHS